MKASRSSKQRPRGPRDSSSGAGNPREAGLGLTKWLAPAVLAALLLTGCGGGSEIDAGNTAKYVADVVLQQTGFRPVDVQCPSGVPASAGRRLRCHFTGPEGPYTAYLKVVKVHGSDVAFELKTQPSSWPAPKLR